jgi:putative transcriptional regulator
VRSARLFARGVRGASLTLVLALSLLAGPGAGPPSASAIDRVSAPPGGRPAKGKLLVASSNQDDPNFAQSVVLLVAYDSDEGAMGVIVNQPTPIKLAKILPEVDGVEDRSDKLWRGGPVLPTSLLTLVRSKQALADSEPVFDDVRMLTSKEAFARTLGSKIPREKVRAFAGHAGWGPGQLESEIANGDWVVLPATAEVVFSAAPEGVWQKLVQRGEGEWTRAPHHSAAMVAGGSSLRGWSSGWRSSVRAQAFHRSTASSFPAGRMAMERANRSSALPNQLAASASPLGPPCARWARAQRSQMMPS